MPSVSPSISPTLPIQSHFRKPMLPFHTSTTTKAFSSLLKMAKVRQTPKPISISAHWVPNYPPDQPSKTPVPPEFPSRPQTDPPSVPSVPPDVPRPPNVPDFDPIPLERPADPPPLSPGPNPGPDFPGPPLPSPPGPDAPRPPIPSPPGPDVPKGPRDVYPPNGPDIVPPTLPEIVPPLHPTQPEIPPPFNPYMKRHSICCCKLIEQIAITYENVVILFGGKEGQLVRQLYWKLLLSKNAPGVSSSLAMIHKGSGASGTEVVLQ